MATSCERRVDHCRHELAQALGLNCMPALHAKRQPHLKQRGFRTFEQMAPATVRKLIECNGYKRLIGIGAVQVQALCDLGLARAQFALEHDGDSTCIALPYGGSDLCRAFDNAVCARLVANLDFFGVEPLDTCMHHGATHLAHHDRPKRSMLFGRRAHRQAQPHALATHHQTRAITHASETLGDKVGDVPFERVVIHGRNHNAAALVNR